MSSIVSFMLMWLVYESSYLFFEYCVFIVLCIMSSIFIAYIRCLQLLIVLIKSSDLILPYLITFIDTFILTIASLYAFSPQQHSMQCWMFLIFLSHIGHLLSWLKDFNCLCDCHYAILWYQLFLRIKVARSIPCVCLLQILFLRSSQSVLSSSRFIFFTVNSIQSQALNSSVPSLFSWNRLFDIRSLMTAEHDYYSIIFSS